MSHGDQQVKSELYVMYWQPYYVLCHDCIVCQTPRARHTLIYWIDGVSSMTAFFRTLCSHWHHTVNTDLHNRIGKFLKQFVGEEDLGFSLPLLMTFVHVDMNLDAFCHQDDADPMLWAPPCKHAYLFVHLLHLINSHQEQLDAWSTLTEFCLVLGTQISTVCHKGVYCQQEWQTDSSCVFSSSRSTLSLLINIPQTQDYQKTISTILCVLHPAFICRHLPHM